MVAGSSPTRRRGSTLKVAPWSSPTSRSRGEGCDEELKRNRRMAGAVREEGRARATARVARRRAAMLWMCYSE